MMLPESLLQGENAAWLDERYRAWLDDPGSVDPQWAELFEQLDEPERNNGHLPGDGPSFRPRSIFSPGAMPGTDAISQSAAERQARVAQLINSYRVRGHMAATIDPLERREIEGHPELSLGFYGLSEADLDAVVPTSPLNGIGRTATLRDIVAHCKAAYCGSIGAEFMNITDNEQKHWVQEQLETLPNRGVLNPTEEARVYRKLADAENFERLLHTRFPGTKRFSLEGAETLIPLLDLVIEEAGQQGIREVVFGMAHRGRLNSLVNILEKPARLVVSEFQGVSGSTQGSGDVKYHLGYSADTTTVHGHHVHLSLTPNPSHLEAVNPIVQGRVRAKQERIGDRVHEKVMPLLIHGDAAFSGQGLVMETLNLSELSGYRTGGTIHVIVNNQIGFTTPPSQSRSTPYATDIARMLAIPIFHVNGEDPRAVAAVTQMAVEWRQRFHRDVVIDMYCYRKHGHNEGDEPSFTQPLMYEAIRSRPTPREVYGKHLLRIGALTQDDLDRIDVESQEAMSANAAEPEAPAARQREPVDDSKGADPDFDVYFTTDEVPKNLRTASRDAISPFKGLWAQCTGATLSDPADTTFDRDRLVEILELANTAPADLKLHRKIKRLFKQRLDVIRGDEPIDWALGEQAAFGTLLDEGHPVRLSGQDCGRGTFSHRHAVVTDVASGREFYPLSQLDSRFSAIDSSLSEAGVLGFEVGYAMDTPEGLTMWEAQFGDFANGAQIIVDQFITASWQKWGRFQGLVMLLPHGYEGQGPEHSSARIERYLLQCAQDNMTVANVTSPAQLFHLLRLQVLRKARAPLVLFTPKSLLRHPLATSRLSELAEGAFRPVVDDPRADPEAVRRVVLCSGRVFVDLFDALEEAGRTDVAVVRVERLYPWPAAELDAVLERYPDADLVWCQEEPRNMGPWPVVLQYLLDHRGPTGLPRFAGRPAAASPATGSHKKHLEEQAALIESALSQE